MATKSPSKWEVRSFVKKVRRKALEAIDAKYEVEYNNAIIKYLDKVGIDYKFTVLEAAVEVIKEKHSEIFQAVAAIQRSNYPDVKKELPEFLTNYRTQIFTDYAPDDDEVKLVLDKWARAKGEVNENYQKIDVLIDNVKSGKKAATLLISLGFDVSSIFEAPKKEEVTIGQIDKGALFPCKDNK